LGEEVNINHDRIYLIGFSNGASMIYRALCESPDTFSGIAAVGGSMFIEQDCPDEVHASVLIMHGTGDTLVPFDGSDDGYSAPETVTFWAKANECEDEDVQPFDPDFYGIAHQFFNDCAGGNLVMLYAISGLGHTWPGANQRLTGRIVPRQIDANFIIWGFFEISYLSQQAARLDSTDIRQ
jgi:polyhydroxybutyrate depolymerase